MDSVAISATARRIGGRTDGSGTGIRTPVFGTKTQRPAARRSRII